MKKDIIFPILVLIAAAAAVTTSRAASASPSHPDVVRRTLSLSYAPPCSLCHDGGRTGTGTVTTPFGRAMRARGAKGGGDDAAVTGALTKLVDEKPPIDSDLDGVSDVDELKAGTDPNAVGGASADVPAIGYGCGGATVAAGGVRGAGGWLLILAGVSIWLSRRRRGARGLAVAASVIGVAGLWAGCYEISYVSTDKCASGAMWTGIGESPLMKPGQACGPCHGGGKKGFSASGTLYTKINEKNDCVGTPAAKVVIQGADGRVVEMTPNASGNFYTSLAIAMPYRAKVVAGARFVEMDTPQTSGDCNSCHTETGNNGAPGRILPP